LICQVKPVADVSLILPAFNEAGSIRSTIQEAVEYFRSQGLRYQIIVAADGTDGTRERAAEMAVQDPAITVFGHPERRGKGRGVREAAQLATGAVVGYADADNKVPIEEYSKIAPWFARGYDAVIGSRAIQRSLIERRQPLYRRLGGAAFHLVMQTVVGLPGILDSQCGFKFFSQPAAREIFRRQRIDGYMFDVEILALAQRLGYAIKQVPIRWRDYGDSRLELVRGNLSNMRDILRIRWLHGGARRRRPREAGK
jgi:dolichyl-phosphate beta-glucosyltransferase